MSESKKSTSTENSTKLPISIRLRSFSSGVKKDIRLKKEGIKKFLTGEDFKALKNTVLRIFFNGLFITISLSYFTGFRWILIPITGCTWYILKKELLPEIRQLVSSFNLVRIMK
jgi:hypothetical protein